MISFELAGLNINAVIRIQPREPYSSIAATDCYFFTNNAFQSLGFIQNSIGINWTQLPNKATKRQLNRVQANRPPTFRRAFGLIHSD